MVNYSAGELKDTNTTEKQKLDNGDYLAIWDVPSDLICDYSSNFTISLKVEGADGKIWRSNTFSALSIGEGLVLDEEEPTDPIVPIVSPIFIHANGIPEYEDDQYIRKIGRTSSKI
jgi:hypothetical protein